VFTLKSADHPYRILVETMNEGAITLLPDGTVLYSNRRFADMLGRPPEKVAGASVYQFVADRDRDTLRELVRIGLSGRSSQEAVLVCADGSFLPALLSVNRVDIEDVRAVCVVATDLTPQKRNEEIVASERLARSILDQAVEAIIVCDAAGTIIRANQVARALRGADVLGFRFDDAFPLTWSERSDDDRPFSVATVLEGEKVHGAQLCLRDDPHHVTYLLVSAGPLTNDQGVVIGCVVSLTDFTESRSAQEALLRTNAELEQFAFAAAHDLQEPLRMVTTYSQLLLRQYGEKVGAEARQLTDFIDTGVKRMQALLRDLLSYSRVVHEGDLDHKPADANKVLEVAIENCLAAIQERNAAVTHDQLPHVLADEAQLTEVFQNLISNAVKYCNQHQPRIHVSASFGEHEHLFSVNDNGIGIPEQYRERIFGLFKRLHGREYPGTGIGLALCKRVVEKHGGRIWVESTPGQGSTFYFTLKAARPTTSRPN
jgi:PAS domain S-box-containing protein